MARRPRAARPAAWSLVLLLLGAASLASLPAPASGARPAA